MTSKSVGGRWWPVFHIETLFVVLLSLSQKPWYFSKCYATCNLKKLTSEKKVSSVCTFVIQSMYWKIVVAHQHKITKTDWRQIKVIVFQFCIILIARILSYDCGLISWPHSRFSGDSDTTFIVRCFYFITSYAFSISDAVFFWVAIFKCPDNKVAI